MPRSLLFIPFEGWHISAMRSRPEQMAEHKFIDGLCSIEEYGNALQSSPIKGFTACVGGEIVTSCGIYVSGNIGEAWAFMSDSFTSISPRHQLMIAREMKSVIESSGLQRVQATCEEGLPKFSAFLERLGMQFEGVLRNYGVDKVNHKMYSYIGD